MLNEGTLMAKLHHRHIVGMVGICQADSIMLVLELAPLGPLNKYLKKNRSLSFSPVIFLVASVSADSLHGSHA